MSTAVVWVSDFPFLSKVAPENSCRRASLSLSLAWHYRLRSQGAPSLSPSTFPSAQREPCAVEAVGMWACFRAVSPPLGPSHRRSPDPCASNVNNPAFPRPWGEGRVSNTEGTVSNTARFNSPQSLRNSVPLKVNHHEFVFLFVFFPPTRLLRGFFGRALMIECFEHRPLIFLNENPSYFKLGWCCLETNQGQTRHYPLKLLPLDGLILDTRQLCSRSSCMFDIWPIITESVAQNLLLL